MDGPQDDLRETGPTAPTQAELESALDADVKASRTVSAEPILARMRATAERIRRERHPNEAERQQTE